ncbi:MAG: hypothetical protein WB816_15810 [Methylocystis sp.]
MLADHQYRQAYAAYGLTLLTDLPLNLPAAGGSDAVVAVDVASPDQFPSASERVVTDPDDWIQLAIREDDSLHMRWGSYFEILAPAGGKRVLCHNLSELPLTAFEAYLTNFAVAAALIQRGEEPLHATVVDIGGRAVGLLGASGAGKSTLAAVLIDRGGVLVTDDMLRVTFEDEAAFAQCGPYRIKLFKEPADRYLAKGVHMGSWNPFGEKSILKPTSSSDGRHPRRLSALYRLDAPSAPLELDRSTLEQLSGAELFKTILASSMNTRLQSPQRLQRQFLFAERLARVLPVYRLTYPRDFDVIDRVADCILDHAANQNRDTP